MSQLKELAAIVRGGMAKNTQIGEPHQIATMQNHETRLKAILRREVAARKPLRITGKSSNPEYEPVKVYVQSDMRKKALWKWGDEGGRDLSDLIEMLFAKYLAPKFFRSRFLFASLCELKEGIRMPKPRLRPPN